MLARKNEPVSFPQSGPEEDEDDTALLARVAAGEAAAFRGLVDRHLPTVLAISRRMLRDDAEAEDVAQETLLRLWRNAAGLELGPNGVRPWLRRVASNLCIDRVRARRNTTWSTRGGTREQAEPPDSFASWPSAELGARVDVALRRAGTAETGADALSLRGYEPDRSGRGDGHIGRGLDRCWREQDAR